MQVQIGRQLLIFSPYSCQPLCFFGQASVEFPPEGVTSKTRALTNAN
jgi:hypothetical protein